MIIIADKCTPADIMATVANEVGISVTEMKTRGNATHIVWARMIATLIIKTEFPYYSENILAVLFGGVVSKSVFGHYIRTAKNLLEANDAQFITLYKSIIKQLEPCLRSKHL